MPKDLSVNAEQAYDARFVRQPGPEQYPRVLVVEARGRSFSFALEPGVLLLEAIRRGFADQGLSGGIVELGALALGPLAYVMPALSTDGANAAFYSETFRPSGVSRLEAGAMTFGLRDQQPFFHCHALWREADGRISGGHILPEETVVAERITVTALGIDGATFENNPDPETNFRLFGPVATPRLSSDVMRRVLVMRLRPNQDFTGALEAACRTHGISHARIRGGVGSTIGGRLADGTEIRNFATEVFVRDGEIILDAAGRYATRVDVGVVDYTGGLASGRLLNGENTVLMTFELVLEDLSA